VHGEAVFDEHAPKPTRPNGVSPRSVCAGFAEG
jgi:hypothetical protein